MVKSAVVSASCAGFPAGCPAMMLLSRADNLADLSRRVLKHLRTSGPRGDTDTARVVLAKAIVDVALQKVAESQSTPLIASAAAVITKELSSVSPVDLRFISRVVDGTLVGIGKGGLDGLISWGVGNQ